MYRGTGQLYSGMGETWWSVVTDEIKETFAGPMHIKLGDTVVVIPGLGPPSNAAPVEEEESPVTSYIPYIVGGVALYLLLKKR